jgi:hypothetical protein
MERLHGGSSVGRGGRGGGTMASILTDEETREFTMNFFDQVCIRTELIQYQKYVTI